MRQDRRCRHLASHARVDSINLKDGRVYRWGSELSGSSVHERPITETQTRSQLIAELEAQQKARLRG